MQKDKSGTREAQRRYRSRQKRVHSLAQAKLEEFRQRVEILSKKSQDMNVRNAGLTSQNRLLEQAAAAVEAKRRQADTDATATCQAQNVWDERTGKAWAEYANIIKRGSQLIELTPEEGRKLKVSDIAELAKDYYRLVSDVLVAPLSEAEKTWKILGLLEAKVRFREALELMGARAAAIFIPQLGLHQNQDPPTVEVIEQGLDILDLSEDQKQDMLSARRRLLRRHHDIQAQRMEIIKRMQASVDTDQREDDQYMSRLLEEVEALEDLKRNLESEHTMAYGFHSTFGESITPLQFARVLAFNRSHNVKPWTLVQMLAARQEAARSGVTDRTASLEDICQTLEFGAPAKEPQPGTLAAEQEERLESGIGGEPPTPSGADVCDSSPSTAALGPEQASIDRSGPEGGAMQSLGSLDALLEGPFLDEVLSDLQDPFDFDFGRPANGSTEPLWNLVSNFSAIGS